MKLGSAAALAACAVACPALAEPVYLNCHIVSDIGTDPADLDVSLNEDAGNAVVATTKGYSSPKLAAAFTQRDVTFSDRPAEVVTQYYRIDRASLEIVQTTAVGANRGTQRRGTCTLAPKVERKF